MIDLSIPNTGIEGWLASALGFHKDMSVTGVVLRSWKSDFDQTATTEWATHEVRAGRDGWEYEHGHYFSSLDEATSDYRNRIKRQHPAKCDECVCCGDPVDDHDIRCADGTVTGQ